MSNAETVYLVSCVGKKLATPAAAQDLYASEWFLRARRYVKATGCPWFVLSAKYGLVASDKVLPPYEHTLNTKGIAERRAWARHVQQQMDTQLPPTQRIAIFAGKRYREFLLPYLQRRCPQVEVPMETLAIGEQLSWFGHHTAARVR